MQRFHWTAGNTVFEAEIDAEHRAMLRLCDELSGALDTGANADVIADAVRRLAGEVEGHFAHEERLMRAAGYSAYAWHKREHDGARRRLQALAGTPRDLLQYLAAWFQNHTSVADRMMAAALRNASRAQSAPQSAPRAATAAQ